ncbi:C69 family dipeptidase [Mycoplasma sp. P36-A1]|uniref:C69 family dipeptidase n=1 Tax=Mycoplasma sp. P36-A1 TaxID=3252900 RepID=UPI003C2F7E46
MKKWNGECTTILVGKDASIDGSTMIARNEDGHEAVGPKQFLVINPEDQMRSYESVISKVKIELPDNPLRYTVMPNAVRDQGIWGEAGINSKNVAMSATETITTNARILGVDPYVDGGIGEEDMVTIVLPYISSAKEGVERLGMLTEKFGTYEPNGVAFSDKDEVWWYESIGGHHWAAVRVPDDSYVVAPNRFNIDHFDFASKDYLCSKDLEQLIMDNNLNASKDGSINLRHIFGSATIKDHHYNNPRTWYIQKFFNKELNNQPMDDDQPFILVPNKKICMEDIKFLLSSHYQDTPYDPYSTISDPETKKLFRPIGINRNHSVHLCQIRNNVPEEIAGVHWLAFGPNTFNALVPFYSNVTKTPKAYANATGTGDFTNMYWLTCAIALLGDYNYDLYSDLENAFEQNAHASFRNITMKADKEAVNKKDINKYLEKINDELSEDSLKRSTKLLEDMVVLGSPHMKLRYSLGD